MTPPITRSAIAVAGLRKSFGDKVVLDGIDLRVAEGTIFALLGPNGAGKTTMVQILSTLIGADAGEVAVGGHDLAQEPDAVRSAIGVTGQFSAVDQLLTGEENLLLMADLRHLDRVESRRRAAELLDRFDLVEAARKPAGTYSGGMRRRIDLAMTWPWSITAMWPARWSASSMYWVVSSSVVPSATSSRITAHSPLRLRGSRPVVGSSRNSTGGWPTRLAARSRRRRMPPE